jgi:hypothetical protein
LENLLRATAAWNPGRPASDQRRHLLVLGLRQQQLGLNLSGVSVGRSACTSGQSLTSSKKLHRQYQLLMFVLTGQRPTRFALLSNRPRSE